MDENKLKTQFGIAMKLYGDSYKAAFSVFPEDTAKAVWAASHWIKDPIVLNAKPEEESEEDQINEDASWKRKFYQAIPELLQLAESEPKVASAKIAIWDKVLQVSGNIQPRTAAKNNAGNGVPRIMEVPVFSSEKDWEAAAAKQQDELLHVSTTRH